MIYTLKRDDIPLLSQWIKKFDLSKQVEFFGDPYGNLLRPTRLPTRKRRSNVSSPYSRQKLSLTLFLCLLRKLKLKFMPSTQREWVRCEYGTKKDIFAFSVTGVELSLKKLILVLYLPFRAKPVVLYFPFRVFRLCVAQHHLPKATSLRSTSFAACRNIVFVSARRTMMFSLTLKMMWASPNDVVSCGHK